MSYSVITIKSFDRQVKRLIKKYPSLKAELVNLVLLLKENAEYGVSLGNNCFKIRIAITSKGKGKSGGARIITNFYVQESTVILLTIYDKSEQGNISEKQILDLLSQIPF
ncbi:type II toxin-antitoxin system RelE/ParE family toxin [Olivibacter sitiensis]|uniref:type II toxin-antitoxin system RelE/ParE family toxin n=1 Tax=Olivibacter sitiensis TaxID=376470 RepID=UPI0004813357|nr:type II toxin-antitoxin system RelE/ParE family toxin [Olivibacter sitiensis]